MRRLHNGSGERAGVEPFTNGLSDMLWVQAHEAFGTFGWLAGGGVMVDAGAIGDQRSMSLACGQPALVAFLISEKGDGRDVQSDGQMHDAGIGADMQPAALQDAGQLSNAHGARQQLQARVIDGGGELPETGLFPRFLVAGSHHGELREGLPEQIEHGGVVFHGPFFDGIVGVEREMDCGLGDDLGGPGQGCLVHLQIESRRGEVESASCQDLPALLEKGEVGVLARDPVADQPWVPEVLATAHVSQSPACATEGSQNGGAVSTGEVEGDVKLFPAHGLDEFELVAKGAFGGIENHGPGPVQAGSELQDFSSHRRRKDMDLSFGIMSFEFPEGRDAMQRVPKETQIDNHYSFCLAAALIKAAQAGRFHEDEVWLIHPAMTIKKIRREGEFRLFTTTPGCFT